MNDTAENQPYQRRIPAPEDIPAELRALPIWCCWRLVYRDGKRKPDKVPVSAVTGSAAGWSKEKGVDFTTAAAKAWADDSFNGIGIVLKAEHGIVGGDLDGCIEDGLPTTDAYAIVKEADTYTETSPGLSGYRFIAKGTFGGHTGRNAETGVELYEDGRFLTITGRHVPGTPMEIRERDLTGLGARFFSRKAESTGGGDTEIPAFKEVDLRALPDGVRNDVQEGLPEDTDRSSRMFTLAMELLQAGLSRDEAICVLADPGNGISAAALDRRDGDAEGAMQWVAKYCVDPAVASGHCPARDDFDELPPLSPGETRKPKRRGFQLIRAGEMELKAPRFVVKDYLEADSLALMFGDPGCGKSFLAVDLACCISTGHEFHGQPVRQGPVVYVAGEGHNGVKRRLTAWSIRAGVDLATAPLFVSTAPAALTEKESVRAVVEAVDLVALEYGNPALVVLDTVARNFGPGDENSTGEMGAFIQSSDILRTRYGAAMLMVHHTGHGEKHRARGSIALKGALDTEYRTEKGEEDGLVRFEATKMKDAELPPAMAFEIEPVELWGLEDEYGRVVTSAVLSRTEYVPPERAKSAKKLGGVQAEIMKQIEFMQEEGKLKEKVPAADVRAACIEAGKGAPSVSRAIKSMVEDGYIGKDDTWLWII